jgi:dihydrofolate reductase
VRRPLVLIVAMTPDRVIGVGGGLPWRIPEDLRHFKATTMGHAIVMGRKTFDEVGRPLPGRRNIVITRQAIAIPDVEVARSLDDAVELARTTDPEPYVVGGAEIYRLALPVATRLVVTWVDRKVEGDTHFPAVDWSEWREVERRAGEEPGVAFVWYERQP